MHEPEDKSTSDKQEPARVLQVFDCMDAGGAETRMVEVMSRLDRREVRLDYCAVSGRPGSLDGKIRALGGEIHYLPLGPRFPDRFAKLLRQGHYDAVHTHAFHTSGVFLKIAHWAGTPVRIVHYQTTGDGRRDGVRRRLTRAVGKRWTDRHATHVIGVCEAALGLAWRRDWRRDPRCQVVYSGIDTSGWPSTGDRAGVRQEWGLPVDARILIHVGNLTPPKNHARLVEVFASLLRKDPSWRLMLVGHAPDARRLALEQRTTALGLGSRVTYAGRRSDVGRLLWAADAMAFPSVREGLPGAVLEACATGLPTIATDLPGIVEVESHLESLKTLSLSASDTEWSDAILAASPESRRDVARRFKQSPFSLEAATHDLSKVWRAVRCRSERIAYREAA